MSLAGTIMRRGSTVTVYHGLETAQADQSTVRTYPTNTPDVRMLLEDITDEQKRRVFGDEPAGTVRALVTGQRYAPLPTDLLRVTAGAVHVGETFKITGVLRQQNGRSPHVELLLATTTEAVA